MNLKGLLLVIINSGLKYLTAIFRISPGQTLLVFILTFNLKFVKTNEQQFKKKLLANKYY